MRVLSFLIVYAVVCPTFLFAQRSEREVQADEVKTELGKVLARSKPKVEVVLRDLREVEGKLVGLYQDSFVLKPKGKNALVSVTIGSKAASKKPVVIKYKDVLQMEGKGILLSFVPDPKRSPFSVWDDVRELGVGEVVHVEMLDGKRYGGAFLKASHDSVSMMRGNSQRDFEKKSVARVYRVRGGSSARLSDAATKGTDITDDILPIGDPSARAHPAALAIGAGIATLIFMLPKGTKRVLVYAQ